MQQRRIDVGDPLDDHPLPLSDLRQLLRFRDHDCAVGCRDRIAVGVTSGELQEGADSVDHEVRHGVFEVLRLVMHLAASDAEDSFRPVRLAISVGVTGSVDHSESPRRP